MGNNKRPLDGIVVVDLTRALSGPICADFLADWGARVIKIENCDGTDMSRGINYDRTLEMDPINGGDSFNAINRNKDGMCINLRTDEGKAILREMLKKADVLLSNYRPGTTKKMGLHYDAVKALNPRLVVGEISAFREKGRENEAGFDLVVQAASGIVGSTGFPDAPCKTAFSAADVTGGLVMTQGIMLALFHRERTGKGQFVKVTMQDASMFLFAQHVTSLLRVPEYDVRRNGLEHVESAPNGGFRTKDGIICIVPSSDKLFAKFAEEVLEMPELVNDKRFCKVTPRMENREALTTIIEDKFVHMTTAQVHARMQASGLPSSPIVTPKEAFQTADQNGEAIVATVQHPKFGPLKVIGTPIEMSDTPAIINKPAPRLGQDTEKILKIMVGLDDEQIAELEAKRVVRCLRE